MNILITGCLGHIGSFFLQNIDKLKSINKVYCIDNNLEKINSLLNIKTKKKFTFIYDDLKNSLELNKLKKIDIVVHFASITNAEASVNHFDLYKKNNIGSLKTIVNFCIKKKSNLIHISSTSVYGVQKKLVDEDPKNLNPQSPYAKIKVMEEKLIRNSKGLKFVSLRFGTICGFSNGMRFHTAVNKFCLQAVMNKKITVWKTAMNQFRPYLSINDAFKAINFVIDKKLFNNQNYNILTENLTVRNIISEIKKNKYSTKVKLIKSKIMNQLTYKVSKIKIQNKGLKLNHKVKFEIKKTLNSLGAINNAR